MDYNNFLKTKTRVLEPSGLEPDFIHPRLFPFQAAVARWSIRQGRACIFADCGLGKTLMQLEWSRQMPGRVLIVAPLGVTAQTIEEARRMNMGLVYDGTGNAADRVTITNYERLDRFRPDRYQAIVLDESSILKSLDGKTRSRILKNWCSVPYRLACTATPAPNDLIELGNHAEFVGVCSNREMSATFFVKESNSTAWRLKGHAREAFYQWLASWSVYIRKPSDLGFDDDGFVLPRLCIEEQTVTSDYKSPGQLFPGVLGGLSGRQQARRQSITERVELVGNTIRERGGQWIVWCGLNDESSRMQSNLNGRAVEVTGSMTPEDKLQRLRSWLEGEVDVLITKPKIFGFGMNFQHCSQMAFLGIGDSYEAYYQAIRRCWRFGQRSDVTAVIVTSEAEREVVLNVKRKEVEALRVSKEVVKYMKDEETRNVLGEAANVADLPVISESATGWIMHRGDSAEVLRTLDDASIGLSVFSPPFVSLYTYTATPRDLGNSKDEAQFFKHFRFIISELLRVTASGRNCCVHVAQIPAMLVRDGYIGLKDFRSQVVQEFIEAGWIYHGEVVIDKDPQAQAIRTKSKSLLFVTLKKDSSWLRPALADYILVFRKPGDNVSPIIPNISNDDWIQWARPIWYGIDESDTLNYRDARTDKDERHICPLQLGTIERCVRLWSNPGDMVLSPFAGIGSEGVVAVRNERLFTGIELKDEYFRLAVRNLREVTRNAKLFA